VRPVGRRNGPRPKKPNLGKRPRKREKKGYNVDPGKWGKDATKGEPRGG